MTCFINAHREQDLVNADLRQIERARACSGDSRSAACPVLRETDIRSGSDRRCVVRRHQRIKIRIVQDTSGGALGAYGPGCPDGALGAGRPGVLPVSLVSA